MATLKIKDQNTGEWKPIHNAKGDTALTVNVGTTTTGEEASVTNSGTNTDVVLDFVIPKAKDGHSPVKGVDYFTDEEINEILQEAKDYTDTEIANFDFIKIVQELPETGLVNRTYFVPKTTDDTNDLYDEYMWVNNAWEFVGTKQIEVDLSDYYNKAEVDEKIEEIEELSVADYDSLPVGTILDYDGEEMPVGYEEVDNVLYENSTGSNENIPLRKDVENYDFLEVYGYENVNNTQVYTKYDLSSSKLLNLSAITSQQDSNLIRIVTQSYTVSGTTITKNVNAYANIFTKTINAQGPSGDIYITKVVGCKEV